jgi:hypothetical protein
MFNMKRVELPVPLPVAEKERLSQETIPKQI